MDTKTKKRPRGKVFVKGDKRAGRPKGCQNKVTTEVREAAGLIVDDPVYREVTLQKARNGTLHHTLQALFWAYRYGKPKEKIEMSGPDGAPLLTELAIKVIEASNGEPEKNDP